MDENSRGTGSTARLVLDKRKVRAAQGSEAACAASCVVQPNVMKSEPTTVQSMQRPDAEHEPWFWKQGMVGAVGAVGAPPKSSNWLLLFCTQQLLCLKTIRDSNRLS